MNHLLAVLLLFAVPAAAHDWNGIVRKKDGTLFVIDAEDGQIWKVSPKGEVAVFIEGKNAPSCKHPHHLAIDRKGTLWLAGG